MFRECDDNVAFTLGIIAVGKLLVGVIVLRARRNKSESDNQTVCSTYDRSAFNRFVLVAREINLVALSSRDRGRDFEFLLRRTATIRLSVSDNTF